MGGQGWVVTVTLCDQSITYLPTLPAIRGSGSGEFHPLNQRVVGKGVWGDIGKSGNMGGTLSLSMPTLPNLIRISYQSPRSPGFR